MKTDIPLRVRHGYLTWFGHAPNKKYFDFSNVDKEKRVAIEIVLKEIVGFCNENLKENERIRGTLEHMKSKDKKLKENYHTIKADLEGQNNAFERVCSLIKHIIKEVD